MVPIIFQGCLKEAAWAPAKRQLQDQGLLQGFPPQDRATQGLFSITEEGLQLVQQISNTSSKAGIAGNAFPGLLQLLTF